MDFSENLNMLPENIKEYFCGNDLRIAMERACFLYEIREDNIEKITLSIRGIFFKEVALAGLPLEIQKNLQVRGDISCGIAYELNKKIFSLFPDYFTDAQELLGQWEQNKIPPIISEEKAWRRVIDIEPWILEQEENEKNQAAEARKKIDSISLPEALKKYPDLGEGSVSLEQIKLKYFPTPVKPSIKNWITDFHDNMGSGKHSAIDRGNYLFHSENGKKLSSDERQKLSLILKSLEEGTLLDIDPERQIVVFGNNGQSASYNQQQNAEQASPVSMQGGRTANHESRPVSQNVPWMKVVDEKEAEKKLHQAPALDMQPQKPVMNIPARNDFARPERTVPQAETRSRNLQFSAGEAGASAGFPQAKQNDPQEDIFQKYSHSGSGRWPMAKKQAAATDYVKQNASSESQNPKVQTYEPKYEPGIGSDAYFSNFASSDVHETAKKTSPIKSEKAPVINKINFSSPQKLPVEQNLAEIEQEAKKAEEAKTEVRKDQITPQPKPVQQARWHIGPSRNYSEENESDIPGNIIDLRS